ncbi:MAG: phage baseplate assembly protein V [bacterium]
MNERAGGGGRRIRGVAVGVVTNISDPQQWGRVKVRLPWLDGPDAAIESHWARVAGWYAGNSRGTMFVPEVGDEVLVAFEGGDPNHPYVLGAVWNGEHAVPGPGNPDGANDHKWFRSRAGHDLEFLDSDGAEKIRLVDSSTNNSTVFDTAADTITTEAKTGTINIRAPQGLVKILCVDLKMTTSQGRTLEVGTTHTVNVGSARTVNVSAGNFVELAGSAMTITTPQIATSTKSDVGVSAGAMVMNQGQISTEVGEWGEVQQGPVVRTVGSQTVQTDGFMTVNMAGELSGTFTLLAGSAMSSAKGGFLVNGGPVTVMGGLVNAKAGSMVVAKDASGGKAALSSWLGGLLLLNPNALTFPATKLLDPIMGLDFHTTLPAPLVPPLPPIPLFPTPFMGPILIDFKATVLINFMPAAGAGATALGFHMPPLPWLWPPISHRPMITAAIMALMTAPFNAMLEMARGKVLALASASGNPVFQRGFVADFVGSSHANVNAGSVTSAGKTYSVSASGQGQFAFTRIFPMFSSGQAFLGFLASLLPLPIANASVSIASPTVSVCDAPLGLMIPLGCNSCSDIPVVPNAMAMGFSNVLTGMSIGDFLGALAWGMVQGAATAGFQAGLRGGGNAVARRIAGSNNPRLQNAAQRVNDFVGGNNCIARGHPVDVVSGTVFTRQTDFELFSAQDVAFQRFYNSRATELPGDASALGPGWRHVFDEALLVDETTDGAVTLALRDHEGRFFGFELPVVDGESDFHPAERLRLTRVDGRTYVVRDAQEVERVFRFSGGEQGTSASYRPPVGKRARLVEVRSASGSLHIGWERDRLAGFVDAAGREVVARHDAQGRLTELRLVRAADQTPCDVFLAAYEYTAEGRLAVHIDRARNRRRFRYDARGRLAHDVDRNGYGFHFHYDALDRCTHTYGDDNAFWCAFDYQPSSTAVTDGAGAVTRYLYDAEARVVSTLDAEGGVSQQAWTAEGWLASRTDANGHTSAWTWDAEGRLATVTDPGGGVVSQAYDAGGRLVAMTDPTGRVWTCERDARGQVVRSRSPAGRVRTLTRDDDGRVVEVEEGADRWSRLWSHGLVSAETFPDGVRADYRYDLFGRLIGERLVATDGAVRETTWTRDPEGYITAVDGPGGRRERYSYTPEGQPVRLTVGSRTATRRHVGPGFLAEHVDPLGRTTKLSYDGDFRVLAIEQPGGRRWQYGRDRLGRVVRMRTPDGLLVHYVHDPGGNVIQERRPGGRIQRFFDANGRMTKAVFGPGEEVRLAYDTAGRITRVQAGDDAPVKRAYDADGLLITEVQGEDALRWRRDARGRVVGRRTTWGARTAQGYARDALARLEDPAGGQHAFEVDAWGRRASWRQAAGGTRTRVGRARPAGRGSPRAARRRRRHRPPAVLERRRRHHRGGRAPAREPPPRELPPRRRRSPGGLAGGRPRRAQPALRRGRQPRGRHGRDRPHVRRRPPASRRRRPPLPLRPPRPRHPHQRPRGHHPARLRRPGSPGARAAARRPPGRPPPRRGGAAAGDAGRAGRWRHDDGALRLGGGPPRAPGGRRPGGGPRGGLRL